MMESMSSSIGGRLPSIQPSSKTFSQARTGMMVGRRPVVYTGNLMQPVSVAYAKEHQAWQQVITKEVNDHSRGLSVHDEALHNPPFVSSLPSLQSPAARYLAPRPAAVQRVSLLPSSAPQTLARSLVPKTPQLGRGLQTHLINGSSTPSFSTAGMVGRSHLSRDFSKYLDSSNGHLLLNRRNPM